MRTLHWFRALALGGALLGGASLFLFAQKTHFPVEHQLVASTTYMGPKSPVPGDPQLIRVELLIRDSTRSGGPQIERVEFNRQNIPLQPRDLYGRRGGASFQLPPGKYTLRWTVNRDNFVWPRSVDHEEEVVLDPRDLWLQLQIEGDTAEIH